MKSIKIMSLVICFAGTLYAKENARPKGPYKIHVKYPKRYGFIAPVPVIGQYAEPYKMLGTIGAFVVDPNALSLHAPESLKNLDAYKNNEELLKKNKKNIYAQVIFYDESISGPVDFSKHLNLVLHPFAALARITEGQEKRGNKYFQTQLKAGIFAPYGIMPSLEKGIAINSLDSISLRVHEENGNLSFSPDNARFYIERGRSVVDFWSYAFDDKNVTLTYHIVFAPRKPNDLGSYLGNLIKKEVKEEVTLRKFLYDTLPHELKNKGFEPHDLEAWRKSHKLIAQIFAEENRRADGGYPEFEHIHSLHEPKTTSPKKSK